MEKDPNEGYIALLGWSLNAVEAAENFDRRSESDIGLNWGGQVLIVGRAGHGERFGEACLPVEQFASRPCIFHFDPLERGELGSLIQVVLERVAGYVHRSWGVGWIPGVGPLGDGSSEESVIDAEPLQGGRELP